MSDQPTGYELPTTLAERNEGLVKFWNSGYKTAMEHAARQLWAEVRWQTELQLRGNEHAAVVIDRLDVVRDILLSFKKGIEEQEAADGC